MSLRSFNQSRALLARSRRWLAPRGAELRCAALIAACLALAVSGCGGSNPVDETGGPGGGTGGGAAEGGASGGGQDGGAGGALEAGSLPVVGDDGSTPSGGDASIQTSLDGGMPIPVEPPKPLLDASIVGPPLGYAYAELEYNLERPEALVTVFGLLGLGGGSGTHLFVNDLHLNDGGATVAYGAADNVDGGLVWQKPPATPRVFQIGLSGEGERMLVSTPFKYTLEARLPNPANAASVFRLYLESEQTVWSAAFSADYESITTGALYGVVTRAEAEMRALPLEACLVACGLINSLSWCGDQIRLSTALDCNEVQPDVDLNGDGTNDGYRLIVSFRSRREQPPIN